MLLYIRNKLELQGERDEERRRMGGESSGGP